MKTIFKTVAVVTAFSVCEKVLGFLYRIYLSRTIGTEGLGMYQVAISVFALLLTICCSGTPITVSRLMTKYKAENDLSKVSQVISSGLWSVLVTAIPICIFAYLFRNSLSFLFADDNCLKLFLILLPALIFSSIYAVLRGVFWGNKDFLPYSLIELGEELCMIIVGIILISFATTVYQGTVYATLAVLISFIFSCTLAVIVFFARKNRLTNPLPQIKPLLSSSAPITLMRTANSLTTSLISVILPLRLIATGLPNALAMSEFGCFLGQTFPILFIPTTLIGSFTLVLIPEMSENFYKKKYVNLKNNIEKAVKVTTVISCLFIPVFTVCGKEIGIIVFSNHQCGTFLTASAFLVLFMSLSNITTSMLNSVGLENKTLLYYVIGSLFMLISIWFLPAFIGIYSLLIGFSFIFVLTTVLNFRLLYKSSPEKPLFIKTIATCIGIVLPTMIFGYLLKTMVINALGTVLTFLICGVVMVLFYSLLVFTLCDIKVLFKGFSIPFVKRRRRKRISKAV